MVASGKFVERLRCGVFGLPRERGDRRASFVFLLGFIGLPKGAGEFLGLAFGEGPAVGTAPAIGDVGLAGGVAFEQGVGANYGRLPSNLAM